MVRHEEAVFPGPLWTTVGSTTNSETSTLARVSNSGVGVAASPHAASDGSTVITPTATQNDT